MSKKFTHVLENQLLKLQVNKTEVDAQNNEEKTTHLLEIYPLVQVTGILGLKDYLEEFVEEYILPLVGSGTLTDNPDAMDFTSCSNIDIVRGTWDETNQRVYC